MSFAIKYSKEQERKAIARINALPALIMKETDNLTEEIGKIGKTEIKKHIIQSETPYSRAAQAAGINSASGRRKTGKMYNSVDFKKSVFKNKTRLLVGWVKAKVPQYYRYQESGFKNRFKAAYDGSGKLRVRGNKPIYRMMPNGEFKMTEGMFAIRDTRFIIEKMLPSFRKDYIKNIVRELKKL